MRKMLFIDPGGVHVGHAVFSLTKDGWVCTNTYETTPELAEEQIELALLNNTYNVICYERFKLFGHLALSQIGSEFRASQLIGVIRFLHRRISPLSKLVVQDPNCQPVAEAIANKKGIPLTSVTTRSGGHAKSAELHGIFYIGRNKMPLSVVDSKLES